MIINAIVNSLADSNGNSIICSILNSSSKSKNTSPYPYHQRGGLIGTESTDSCKPSSLPLCTSCHTLLCHVMSYHTMSCQFMTCHVMSCHAMPRRSRHGMSCHGMPRHDMSCHAVPCHFVTCHAMSCITIYRSAHIHHMAPNHIKS